MQKIYLGSTWGEVTFLVYFEQRVDCAKVCLFDWCLTARQHRKVDMCQLWESKTQAVKDDQGDTMLNSSYVTM